MCGRSRLGLGEVIATVLLIALAIASVTIFYSVASSFIRPQPNMSSQVSISAGASGFAVIEANVINTGNTPYKSVMITISGPSASQLQISYSGQVAGNGGNATMVVRGTSGGPYSAFTLSASASGNLVASVGAKYNILVAASLTNGGSYTQALSVTAQP